jgi:hypothetical protein
VAGFAAPQQVFGLKDRSAQGQTRMD